MDNSQRLVVVSGGSKGIGRAIVERFASEGYIIATCSRNEKDLDELKSAVEGKFKASIHTTRADLSTKDGVEHFVEFVRLIAKPIVVLVNNSGRFIPGLVHEEKEGSLEQMIETNLYSAYYVSRGFIPAMKREKTGDIFNICSVASFMAYPNGGSYSISKFAMYGMSKALREELKEFGIRVTAVLPGAVLTDSWEGTELPEERFISVEDVAETIYSTHKLSNRTVLEDIIIRPQLGDI
ncbi:MAG: SDR family oxidoreductase [Cyclobacteriaceae bacterium]